MANFEYQFTDPITGGTWNVISSIALTELGVLYTVMDASLRENIGPTKDGQVTVNFAFKIESDENQKSKGQKLFELLVQQQ